MSAYTGTKHNVLSSTLVMGYGIWNLKFCHLVVPPFGVSENIKNVHVLTLKYISVGN